MRTGLLEQQTVGGVQGELLRWARAKQDLTMRWVRDRGGPSPGYQSEVEHGYKTEVKSELLRQWVRVLNVTEAFARGQIPRCHESPSLCRGLAGHVVDRVRSADLGTWRSLRPEQRVQQVLRLISREPTPLPRVVLAHTMGLEPTTLDAIMTGEHPVLKGHVEAVATLTSLPQHFFLTGELESPDDWDLFGSYLPALRVARKAGIGPEDLIRRLQDL